MLECVINVSEGRRRDVVDRIASAAGDHVLDVHADGDHNRAVVTLAGDDIDERAFAVVAAAVREIDLTDHAGVHPRLGAADVVPFVPLAGAAMDDAIAARDRAARRIARELLVPCFLYGPERTLPDARRQAFTFLAPDVGPADAHPTAGAACVGARELLIAYNLWLAPPATLDDARRIAGVIRRPELRTLGLAVGGSVQVSCNLVEPLAVGPADAFDAVAREAPIDRAELVGLLPADALHAIPTRRWNELDLDDSRTIEARLAQAGLDGGSRK